MVHLQTTEEISPRAGQKLRVASLLDRPYFRDEDAAFAKLESLFGRPVCPHCGSGERISRITGPSARRGLRFCGACRKQFTAKVGTLFEASHVPLHKWLQASLLLTQSDGRVSVNQLHQALEVTYKTAAAMARRLREAVDDLPDPEHKSHISGVQQWRSGN